MNAEGDKISVVPVEINDLLTAWNLTELCSVFQEHKIDWETLTNIDEATIKELIPTIGLRIKFLHHFKNFMNAHEQQIPEKIDEFSDSSLSSTLSSTIPSSAVPSLLNTAIVGLTEKDIVQTPFYTHNLNCARETGLEDLLNSTIKGKLILNSYRKNGRLTPEYRNKLVDLIIETELENDVNKKIACNRFEELAQGIIGIFPTECKEVYYVKTRRILSGKSRYIGRGKIFSKYYNVRKKLKLNGLIGSNNSAENPEDNLIDSDDDNNSAESCNYLEWLKNNKEPVETVNLYWKKSFNNRQRLLKEVEIHQYFENFPVLKNSNGYLLFNLDFDILFPNSGVIYNNWQAFSGRLIEFAKISKEQIVRNLIKEIVDEKFLSDEGKNIRILKLLPYLLNPVAISRKWKPSKKEIDEGFIMHVKSIDNLYVEIEKRNKKLKSFNITFQPLPIIVGEDFDHITSRYVRINQVLYEVESVLKAIEVTFKAVHSLNALYSPDADQVWLILQRALFNIQTEFDKQYTSVIGILPHLLNE